MHGPGKPPAVNDRPVPSKARERACAHQRRLGSAAAFRRLSKRTGPPFTVGCEPGGTRAGIARRASHPVTERPPVHLDVARRRV